MFARTSRKLTIFFSGIMIIFLLLINVTCYVLLSSIIFKEQADKLEAVVIEEKNEHAGELYLLNQDAHKRKLEKEHNEKKDTNDKHRPIEVPLRPFYLLLDHEGHIVMTDADDQELAEDIQDDIEDWIPKENQTIQRAYDIHQGKIHLMLAGRPMYEEGEYIGSIIAGIDITEQRKLLMQLVLTLIVISGCFFIVSILFAYLMSKRSMKPIMQSFAKQQRFTADASHELRTPLTVLQSSMEVLEGEVKEEISSFGKQVMRDMKDEIKRMTRLVSDLLTLARADSSTIMHNDVQFSLDEELERIFRKFDPIAAQKKIKLEMQVKTNAIITADQARFQQLMINLLDNAMQYTSSGGSILVEAKIKGRVLTLYVQDTGIGIPPDKLETIFERFNRLDEARNRTEGHAGLGLSIVKWIAESYGGSIRAESIVGTGSTFIVTLPIVSGEQD